MKKFIYSMFALAILAMTFTSCEDVPAPYVLPGNEETVVIEPTGNGTLESPFNVMAVLNYVNELPADVESTEDVYIKGKVVSVTTNYDESDPQFGNAVFYISDDGTANNQFYVYRALYLGNKKYSSGTTLQKGDEVIICGKVVNYRGTTPETVQSKAFLYSLNGVTEGGGGGGGGGEAKGSGTLEDPYNPVAAANAVKDLTWTSTTEYQKTGDVYVKGKISRIADNGTFGQSGTYGNASFYISEDGTENGEFYCFRILYFNNAKYTSGTDIQVGDEVIVYGKLMNYRGNTPETVAGEAYLYSLNGATEGGSGGGDGGGGGGGGETTGNVTKTVSGTTLTLVVNDATADTDNTITVDFNAQGWTNAQEVTSLTIPDGTVISFAVSSEGGTTPKFYDGTKGVRLYAKNRLTITGKDKAIAKVVLNCDSYSGTDYVGNSTLTANSSGNTLTIVNEHSGTSGGVQLRVKTIEITYAK